MTPKKHLFIPTVLLIITLVILAFSRLPYFDTHPSNVTTDVSAIPTPTPIYLPYLNKPPNYVGTISDLNIPLQITIDREDGSQVILDLKPSIPIFVIDHNNTESIEITTVDNIEMGSTLSVYSRNDSILAIFVLNNK